MWAIITHAEPSMNKDYIGRFAPSPTGKLHLGSLLTAVASFLDAKHQGGQWLVRMEDVDTAREVAGAAADILRTLEKFGLLWDGEVCYQSRRFEFYQDALAQLKNVGLVYPCFCSRQFLHEHASMGVDGMIYSGFCRNQSFSGSLILDKTPAYRIQVPDEVIGFDDWVVGRYEQNLLADIGDFVLKRADGFWAYQLAVVVDDALQGITHVVRGGDLLVSTPRQIYLLRCLGLPVPQYAHLPILVNQRGQKLSKQTHAPAIDAMTPVAALKVALTYLGLNVPKDLRDVAELLLWAQDHWSLSKLPQSTSNTLMLRDD